MAFGKKKETDPAKLAAKEQKAREKAEKAEQKAGRRALKASSSGRIVSSGRGGAGNIRRRSLTSPVSPISPSNTSLRVSDNSRLSPLGRETSIVSSATGSSGSSMSASSVYVQPYEDPISPARGREARPDPRKKVRVSGRGGAGNIRGTKMYQHLQADLDANHNPQTASILREYEEAVRQRERRLIAASAENRLVGTGGRGGIGNMLAARKKVKAAPSNASSISTKSRKSILSSLSSRRASSVALDISASSSPTDPSTSSVNVTSPVDEAIPPIPDLPGFVQGSSRVPSHPATIDSKRSRAAPPMPTRAPPPLPSSNNLTPSRPASSPPKYLNPVPSSAEVIPGANADFDADLALDEEILQHSRMASSANSPSSPWSESNPALGEPSESPSPIRRKLPVVPQSPSHLSPPSSLARRNSRESGRRSRNLIEERKRERRLWERLHHVKLSAPAHAPGSDDQENELDDEYDPVALIGAYADPPASTDSVAIWLQERHRQHVEALQSGASPVPRIYVQAADAHSSHGVRRSERRPLAAIDELHESISLMEMF
ncbi:hypothetical protein PUNSTDRAFT_137943 [Punctularia strigosozonata HHB-11173 SS5]|uniref:Uncharacterized protein n=1 Tax=Punctularia strigosozonata (strain HHB-11173) TaxID=741275 RepID=R7S4V6_PUNST|nr:uncharacterized protein PUNSTDRAFT_137943 [Punctularia strigosozonata HHB-11173 SS5]EIN05258.1 hypothetical protein PUNSTDRAFT_137943 [Punctularia strigosozonata HHB-11173 SS5]